MHRHGFDGLPRDRPHGAQLATWLTMMGDVEAFFRPNLMAFAGPDWPLGADRAGYYVTEPL